MAITQNAYQPEQTPARDIASPEKVELDPIDLDHVSVSQLLGRDYVFIDANSAHLPLAPTPLHHQLLNDLMAQLEVTEAHTVVVTFTGQPSSGLTFTRHDLSWYKHKISRVETHTITNQDQQEFMDMIWQCSTPAAIA